MIILLSPVDTSSATTNENIGKMSPIIYLKAEDKLEVISWKVKRHTQRKCDIVSERIFISSVFFKCWRNKFITFFIQKSLK